MKLRKMLAGFMTLCMVTTAVPATVLAEEGINAPVAEEVVNEPVEEMAEGQTETAVAQIVDGDTYETLAEAVAEAEANDKIVLLKDTEGAGVVIDKNITIDFGGNTYTFTESAVGSKGTESNGFQILKEAGKVTLTNGTLEVAENFKDKFYILVQNYTDLTVKDMTLDGTNLDKWSLTDGDSYVLSNNSGTVNIEGTTIKANGDGDKAFAFDACDYASYDEPKVTVDTDCTVYGKIEVTGEAELAIEGGAFTDLANAVKYAENGAAIKLLESTKGAGIVIDKDITIDFGGNTYDIVGPAVGSAGTTTLGFQILSGHTVTLKDGTITESAPEQNENGATDAAVKMLVQNYSDLTLEDMVLNGSELGGEGRYTLSNNSGNIVITGGTEIIADANGIAFDVCRYASYEVPTVTFKNGSAKGAFEVSEGLEGNLKIESGYFTQDPTAYAAEGKVVKASDKEGYTYMVGDPAPTPSKSSKKSKPKYTASVDKDDVENGDVKLSSTRVKAGSKVTVTVTPDEGYELKKLVILDKNGDKVDVTDNGDGTFTFKMPKGGVEVVPSFVEAEEEPVEKPAENADDTEKTMLVLTIDQKVYQQDGSYAVNDVAPIISGDRTFLPIRLVAEALGATVTWNEAAQSVTIADGDTTIVIYIGQPFATVNGEPVQLDAPAFIANGRTYLPVRFVAETLGAAVTWDAAAKTVTIVG